MGERKRERGKCEGKQHSCRVQYWRILESFDCKEGREERERRRGREVVVERRKRKEIIENQRK